MSRRVRYDRLFSVLGGVCCVERSGGREPPVGSHDRPALVVALTDHLLGDRRTGEASATTATLCVVHGLGSGCATSSSLSPLSY